MVVGTSTLSELRLYKETLCLGVACVRVRACAGRGAQRFKIGRYFQPKMLFQFGIFFSHAHTHTHTLPHSIRSMNQKIRSEEVIEMLTSAAAATTISSAATATTAAPKIPAVDDQISRLAESGAAGLVEWIYHNSAKKC